MVVVLVTADRLTVLFTLLVGVVAAEVGVAGMIVGMIVSGVLGAAKNCAGTEMGMGPTAPTVATADGLVGVTGTLFTCSCMYVCSMAWAWAWA